MTDEQQMSSLKWASATRSLTRKEAWALIEKVERLQAFYNYFDELYGTGLQIENWHLNGELEPFDEFFESARSEMLDLVVE